MVFREIFRHFLLMQRPLAQEFEGVIDRLDLTIPQLKTLDFIETSGECTLVEISRSLSIKKSSVTKVVDSLELKRFVEQVPGKDRREKRIRRTDLGKEVHRACRNAMDAIERRLLIGLSDREQAFLLRALITIRNNLKAGGGPT